MKKYCDTDVLTTGDVSRIACVAPRTVSKWFDSGVLGGYRIPGSKDRRMPVSVVRAFLRKHGMPLNELADSKRVLIIDDDEAAGILKKILKEEHYEVEIATDTFGIAAVTGSFDPHVVLISTEVKGIDAFDIARRLKKQNRKIIALAGPAAIDTMAGPTCTPPTRPLYDQVVPIPFHIGNLVKLIATSMPEN